MKKYLPFFLMLVLFSNLQAQQKSADNISKSQIGMGAVYKLKQQESGIGIRYQLAVAEQTEVILNYSRGYFFRTTEDYKMISTSDVDLDAHYKFFRPQAFNAYLLGGFNMNSRKWVGLYNNSYLKNVDLLGGINAGVGFQYTLKPLTAYVECKSLLFDQGLFATAGISYQFHKSTKQRKGKVVQSRNLK